MSSDKKKSRAAELTDDFIDRQENRYDFKKNLLDVQKRKQLLVYSGVGRVGKTSLLKQFEKIIADESAEKFVRYDFDSNENLGTADMFTALKTLRASLTKKYRVEFPLFDKASIFLAQKSGEFVSAEQQRAVMKSSAMLRGFKSHLNSLKNKTDEAFKTMKLVNSFFDGAGELVGNMFQASLVLNAGKSFVNFLDAQLAAREEKARAAGDTEYAELVAELNERNADESAAPLRELLPRLFAKDLSFWLTANDANLIIFLDAYEKLTGEERGKKNYVRLISENRDVPVDWWVGELLSAERVRWVIAGRYKIEQIGEADLADKGIENKAVDVFNKYWSGKYLEMNGVAEEELRAAIIALTGGHPYYLRKCAETYKNYRLKGKVPRPADFGKNLDEIVEKTVGSLDEAAQLMTQRLCILKSWTDEVAVNVIDNFNPATYSRLKKMVAREEPLSFNDERGYTFDRAIDAFLFRGLKSKVIYRNFFVDLRGRANEFFKKFFDDNHEREEENYFFGMWSEIILRTTDTPAELMKFYHENFEPLKRRVEDSTIEVVVKKFFANVGDAETLPSAYFQSRLAELAKYTEFKKALATAKAAYSKVKKISPSVDELPFKISVTSVLADVFYRLDRYQDEIPLREEIVRDCERCFPAKDDRIIAAKNFLARALERGDKKDDAFKIRQQIFEALDESDGENFIDAAEDFANALEDRGDYKTALSLRKKIVALCEKADDDRKIHWALSDIIDTLKNLSGKEYLEEKVARYYQYMAVAEKIDDTLSPRELNDFAETLKKLGRAEEAEQLFESKADDDARRVEDLERRIESFDEPDSESVALMGELIDLLEETNRYEEAERWKEKISEAVRAIVNRYTVEPVENFDTAISALENCLPSIIWNYEQEAIEIRRAILFLTEKNPDAEESQIIEAKKDLVDKLCLDEENYSEAGRLYEDIENFYRKDLPASREEFVDALKEHAIFFENNLDNYSAAREKLTEALNVLENDSESSADEILDMMDRIADIFDTEENFSEAVAWRERAWKFCKENLLEDDPEALRALNKLIWACERSKDRDKVEEYRQQLQAIKEKNLGSAHVDVISEKEKLASTLHKAGKYDDELKLRGEIVDLYRENFSANAANKYHRGYWFVFTSAMESLAECLDRAGQESAAADLRRQIVGEWKDRIKFLKENSADDYDITDALESVIDALKAVGDSDEELRYRLELVNFCKEKVPNSNDTLRALEGLADFYSEHERKTDEMKTRKEIVGIQKNRLQKLQKNSDGDDDDEIIDALENVIDALNAVGDSDEELRYRLELVNFCKERDPHSDDTLRALEGLADFYSEHERAADEMKTRKEIVGIQQAQFKKIVDVRKAQLQKLKKNSSDDDEIISALENVIDALNDAGDSDEELHYRLELVNFCKERDPHSDDTLNALEGLAKFYSAHEQKDTASEIYKEILENYSLAEEDVAEIQEKIDALNQDAAPEENPSAEIDTSESLALRRGQRVSLTKNNPALNELIIELRWESDDDLELDASAFLLGADGKTHGDEDFIFYGNTRHASGAVELDNGTLHVALKNFPDEVARISFTLTIYEAEERKQNFSGVKVFVRVIDDAARKEIFRFELHEDFSIETAIIVGEIYRHKGEWKFNAVGAGFSGGLKALCEKFGVEVD